MAENQCPVVVSRNRTANTFIREAVKTNRDKASRISFGLKPTDAQATSSP